MRFRKERATTPVIIRSVGSISDTEGNERNSALSAGLTVAEVMQRWPETVIVFLSYRMACIGCLLAPFDTVADVARNYRLDLDELLHDLQDRIDAAARDSSSGP